MQNISLSTVKAMDEHALRQWADRCESQFERQFLPAFDLILKEKVQILFLSGPSCSGKTTATKKLCNYVKRFGKEVVMVSTDDFFLDNEKAPKNLDGSPNYESFDFIDSDLLLETVDAISRGKEYRMPLFDFKTKTSSLPQEAKKATGNELIIVEGIHALNDKFIRETAHKNCAGLYICPGDDLALDSRILLERNDIRFLRRLVRDKRHRNTSSVGTCQMWEHVLEGEDLFITPFIKNADLFINSTFAYEPFVIRDQALARLGEIPAHSIYRFKAGSLTERLERLIPLSTDLVGPDSLLNEFLK